MQKKTFRVQIENVEIFETIMAHFNWKEIDRIATGGMMSQPELLLTYEGIFPLRPNSYIERKDKYTNYYHTIQHPDGFSAKSPEEYFSKIQLAEKFEVKEFTSNADSEITVTQDDDLPDLIII